MTTVSPDPVRVESELVPARWCARRAAPRRWARGGGRENVRLVAEPGGSGVRPRRSRCRACDVTHVLLPATMLARRGDWAELIGKALEAKAAGLGQRPVAAAVRVSRSTVRGWLARFADLAEEVRAHLVRWPLWLDAGPVRIEPSGGPLGDAVAAVAPAGYRPESREIQPGCCFHGRSPHGPIRQTTATNGFWRQ